MSKPETCVCCGRVIPENSHYCVICGMSVNKKKSKNIIKKVTFEIETNNGDCENGVYNDVLAFEITIYDNGEIEVTKTNCCSLADVDNDYIFNTENDLYRIQED